MSVSLVTRGERAVGSGVVGQDVQVGVPADGVPGPAVFAVAGVGAWAAAAFLAVGLFGGFVDGDGEPAGDARSHEGGGGGFFFDGHAGLDRHLGPARRAASASMPAAPTSIRAWRGAPSRAALAVECTQMIR